MLAISRYFIAILPLAFASPALAEEDNISGMYANIPIAYNSQSKIISGYFDDTTGRDGQFSCIFYFSGTLSGNTAHIVSYFPETPAEKIEGELTLFSTGKVAIHLSEEHGGCWNVQQFADKSQTASFDLDTKHPTWESIDIIKSKKAYFYTEASTKTKKKSYLVQGDPVAIIKKENGWCLVEYPNDDQVVSGYIKSSDLYGSQE